MNLELESFNRRLNELETLISMHVAARELMTLAHSGVLDEYRIADITVRALREVSSRTSRSAQYRLSVMDLYAAWEAFVEDAIGWYVRECVSGGILLDGLRSRHLIKTMEIISLKEKGVTRYDDLDVAKLLSIAAKVHEGEGGEFNADALVHHSANVKSKVVRAMLQDVGAGDAWVAALKSEAFVKSLRGTAWAVSDEDTVSFLDDLCQRRNEIAHGGTVADSIDETYIRERVKCFRALATALAQALRAATFQEGSSHYRFVGSFDERFGTSIAIVKPVMFAWIGVGENCFVVGANSDAREMSVESIQIESEERSAVCALGGLPEIGVRFTERIPRKGKVFLRLR